jgi:hypothetical protein
LLQAWTIARFATLQFNVSFAVIDRIGASVTIDAKPECAARNCTNKFKNTMLSTGTNLVDSPLQTIFSTPHQDGDPEAISSTWAIKQNSTAIDYWTSAPRRKNYRANRTCRRRSNMS